ncbi:MAG TPA: CDP-diacylglycerol--serine O-phosphatidyltransferase [Vicinamibacteria bacterium]
MSPRHFSMLRSFHLADFLTLGNGCCGTAAIFFAMAHVRAGDPRKIDAAGVFVALALVFDVMDGRVARWRHRASPMGRELDSLADVISFGVAPAALGYALGLTGIGDGIALLYFVACGISRLARYNITAEQMSQETGKVTYFEGTPIPSSVLLVILLVALTHAGRVDAALPGGAIQVGPVELHLIALLFVLSGSLMISKTLHIPKP